jgi:hypothetical protein
VGIACNPTCEAVPDEELPDVVAVDLDGTEEASVGITIGSSLREDQSYVLPDNQRFQDRRRFRPQRPAKRAKLATLGSPERHKTAILIRKAYVRTHRP